MSPRIRILSVMLIISVGVIAPAGAAANTTRDRRDAPTAANLNPERIDPATASSGRFASPLGSGTALVASTPVGNGPADVAVNPATHTIYVANGSNDTGASVGGNTISVIDGRRCDANHVSECRGPWPTISVGNLPTTIAIDQATDTVYVDNSGDNTVSVFDGATCDAEDTAGCEQTPATVPVGQAPIGIYADPDNHTVYVANNNNLNGDTVSMIDSASCNATDLAACPTTEPPTVTVPPVSASSPASGPGDVDVDLATHTVYVALNLGGIVAAFDATTCNATRQDGCTTIGQLVGDSNGIESAKIDQANETLYTANYDNTISVYDLHGCNATDLTSCAADRPGTVTPPATAPFETDLWLAVDPAIHSVYVVYEKDDALMVVNTNVCNGNHLAACATVDPPEIHTGTNPEWVALDPVTQTLYVSNQDSNDVSVIDATRCDAQTSSGCRQRAPEVSISAHGLAVDPAVGTTYVASTATAVAMIDTRHCNAFHAAGCGATPPTVTVGANPDAVAVNPATGTVYVANQGTPAATGTISVFDDRTCNATQHAGCTTVSTLPVPGGNPVAIAVNPLTDTIYVATTTTNDGPNLISVFNGATCNASHTTGCNQTPANAPTGNNGGAAGSTEDVAVDSATNTIYATSDTLGNPFTGHSVYVINGRTCDAANTSGCGQIPATIDVGATAAFGDANPFGVAVDQATDTIYTANIANGEGPGTVSVINGATCNSQNTSGCGQTPATARAGFGTFAVAVDQISNQVYATNIEDTSVTTINAGNCNGTNASGCNNTRTDAIVGDYPLAISIDPGIATAYVADGGGVSVIPLTH